MGQPSLQFPCRFLGPQSSDPVGGAVPWPMLQLPHSGPRCPSTALLFRTRVLTLRQTTAIPLQDL